MLPGIFQDNPAWRPEWDFLVQRLERAGSSHPLPHPHLHRWSLFPETAKQKKLFKRESSTVIWGRVKTLCRVTAHSRRKRNAWTGMEKNRSFSAYPLRVALVLSTSRSNHSVYILQYITYCSLFLETCMCHPLLENSDWRRQSTVHTERVLFKVIMLHYLSVKRTQYGKVPSGRHRRSTICKKL